MLQRPDETVAAAGKLAWATEALRQQLDPLLPGLTVEVVASIGSTNTELLARAKRSPGQIQPCLLVAEQQTQGRGRQGKGWQSSAGASLTFSLALALAPADWSGLSLAVGLALTEAIDPPRPGQPTRLGIKWPNDLLLREPGAGPAIGRKLGGILIETVQIGKQRVAVVGVGLNLVAQPVDAPSWGYGCVQELDPGLSAATVLALVAGPLVRALQDFERSGFAPLRQRFADRDLLAGRAVTTTLPDLPRGVADGVDDSGTLWLQVAGSAGNTLRWPVRSGEVSLRPEPGAESGVETEERSC